MEKPCLNTSSEWEIMDKVCPSSEALQAQLLKAIVKYKNLEVRIADLEDQQKRRNTSDSRRIGRHCVNWWNDAKYVAHCDEFLVAFQYPLLRAVIRKGISMKRTSIAWVDQNAFHSDELKYAKDHEQEVMNCWGDIGPASIPLLEDHLNIVESTGVVIASQPDFSVTTISLRTFRKVMNFVVRVRDEALGRIGNTMEGIASDLTVTLEEKREDSEQREVTYQSLLASKAQLLARIDDLSDRTGLDVKLLLV
jgi:hypothetical protein